VTRYAITGSSGYIGSRVVRHLLDSEPDCRIVGIDVRPPRVTDPRLEFHERDVRDAAIGGLFDGVDALLHFAFVLDPFYDEREMTDIDLGGTRNVLQAAKKAGVPYILATSSTTAYGALADNPVPLVEESPLRAAPSFVYAHDKRLMDEMLSTFARRNPSTKVCVIRPCIVLGPTVSNYIAATMLALPIGALLDGADPPMQFVHEDDLAALIVLCLSRRASGAFNAVGEGTLHSSELTAMQGKRAMRVPAAPVRAATWLIWKSRLLSFALPPGTLDFFHFPWVASGEKAKRELGFSPRYSTADCFSQILPRKDAIVDSFRARMKSRGRK
jgi:UDP-glucose 4-epimerase